MSSDPNRRQPGTNDGLLRLIKSHDQRIKKLENPKNDAVLIGQYTIMQDVNGRLIALNRTTGATKFIF